MAKSRKFSGRYFEMEFTSLVDNGKEKPQCVLCCSVLSNEAMSPLKLSVICSRSFFNFFQRQKLLLIWQKLDANGCFQEQSSASLTASFEVALNIAKQKKPISSEKPCKTMGRR